MHEFRKAIGHGSLLTGMIDATEATAVAAVGAGAADAAEDRYADSKRPALPNPEMKLGPERTALDQHHTDRASNAHLSWRWRMARLCPIIVLAGVAVVPMVANAATATCGERAELLQQLAQRFSEKPVAVGLSNSGQLIEVLTSDAGSTWTIIISQPNGKSCLAAAGESWQELKHAVAGELGA